MTSAVAPPADEVDGQLQDSLLNSVQEPAPLSSSLYSASPPGTSVHALLGRHKNAPTLPLPRQQWPARQFLSTAWPRQPSSYHSPCRRNYMSRATPFQHVCRSNPAQESHEIYGEHGLDPS